MQSSYKASQVISLVNSYQIRALIVSSRKVFTKNTLYFDMSVQGLHSRTLTALKCQYELKGKKKNGVPCKHTNSQLHTARQRMNSGKEESELLHDLEVQRSPKKTESKSSSLTKTLKT